jgi:hypothetical protein
MNLIFDFEEVFTVIVFILAIVFLLLTINYAYCLGTAASSTFCLFWRLPL